MNTLSADAVLTFLKDNPEITNKRDIARAMNVSGPVRAELRAILKALEARGQIERIGKRSWTLNDSLPPTSLVEFERIDEMGDLVGRAVRQGTLYGPNIVYSGSLVDKKTAAPGPGDRGLCKIRQTSTGWQARLIRAIKRTEVRTLTGLYTSLKRGGGRVTSANRKDRDEILIGAQDCGAAKEGDLVKVLLKASGPGRSMGPVHGEVIEVIGRGDDPKAASLLAIHAHNIPLDFPDEVIAAAKNATPARVIRTDLTQIPLITIDPADARDHDDAIFAEPTEKGWRILIAIADVAAYVTEGSALDREAQKRGNSTYFPDRVVPMLPEDLSAGACSLKEKEVRNCLAVEIFIDKKGHKTSHKFIRGQMRSAAGLSYQEAQSTIDGEPVSERAGALLEPVLEPLWGAYHALSSARDKRAPLNLDLPERRIELDADGRVTRIAPRARLEAHRLVEEMMILANVCAAETLEKHRLDVLYRIHDQPSEAKLAAFADFLRTLNLKWARGDRPQTHRFNHVLAEAGTGDHKDVITQMVLRTQAQAVYAPDNIGHFGLNLIKYAHFTSPIRRYSDLIVHRALIRALDLGPDGLSTEQAARMEELATHLSTTERRSMAAEREATDRYLAHYLSDKVGTEFDGRISGLNKAGLFIQLQETGADGFVPMRRLGSEYWVYEESAHALIARGSGKAYEMGMEVSVRLVEVTPLQGGLILDVLTPPLAKPRRVPATSNRTGRVKMKSKTMEAGSAPKRASHRPRKVKIRNRK